MSIAFFFFNSSVSKPIACESVGWTAKKQIRRKRNDRRDNERLQWVDPAEDNDFVNHVNDNRRREEPGDVMPTLAQQFPPMNRIGENCPSVGRTPRSRVSYASADCQ